MPLNTTMKLLPKDIRGAVNTCFYCEQKRKCFYWDQAVYGNVCYDCFDSVNHTEKTLLRSFLVVLNVFGIFLISGPLWNDFGIALG